MNIMLEGIFFEHQIRDLAMGIHAVRNGLDVEVIRPAFAPVEVNPHATRTGVTGDVYNGYRKGLVGACADVVLVRGGPNPAVPMIYRKNPPFGKTWWIMGGAVHNFRAVHHFLLFKALCEGGIDKSVSTAAEFYAKYDLVSADWSLQGVNIVGIVGNYSTPAEDQVDGNVCHTNNHCYLGVLNPGVEVWHDKDHDAVRWFTFADLVHLKDDEMHWYPKRVAMRALVAYKDAL